VGGQDLSYLISDLACMSVHDMPREELMVLREYLEENLGKGPMRASSAPAGYASALITEPNTITVKNRYLIPLNAKR
jgi:hypothetical protein